MITDSDDLKRVVIREELVGVAGTGIGGMILSKFIYWSDIEPLDDGWICLTTEDISNELMLHCTSTTMRRYLKALVNDGYLEERRQKCAWDKTIHYRVNRDLVDKKITRLGYDEVFVDYQEYIKSKLWAKKREAARKRAGFKCELCYKPKNLNVHHKTYEHLGDERPNELICLCRGCHKKFHNIGGIDDNKAI